MKNNLQTLTYFFYSLLILSIALYKGKNNISQWYAKDPAAFAEIQISNFSPKSLPYLSSVQENFENPLNSITADEYLVVDEDSFTSLIAKNITKKRPPASTVKLATALVAYNTYDLDDVLVVKKEIKEELRMGLKKGEHITALNLFYAMLINSANDAAYTLASNHPKGYSAFIQEMNNLAKKLNMRNTHFVNPIGFDNPKQYTTAQDLALLAREYTKNRTLTTIGSTTNITVSNAGFTRFYPLVNIHQLVGDIPGVGGLKTGYTLKAGQNLITYYLFQGKKPILIILMGSEDRFADTRTIINVLDERLSYYSLAR